MHQAKISYTWNTYESAELRELNCTKPVEQIANLTIEQTISHAATENNVQSFAGSLIVDRDEILSDSGIYSNLEDNEVLYYMQNDYWEPYIKDD